MVGVLGLGIGVNVYGTYYVLAQTGTLSPDFLPTPANLAWARAKLGLDAAELPAAAARAAAGDETAVLAALVSATRPRHERRGTARTRDARRRAPTRFGSETSCHRSRPAPFRSRRAFVPIFDRDDVSCDRNNAV